VLRILSLGLDSRDAPNLPDRKGLHDLWITVLPSGIRQEEENHLRIARLYCERPLHEPDGTRAGASREGGPLVTDSRLGFMLTCSRCDRLILAVSNATQPILDQIVEWAETQGGLDAVRCFQCASEGVPKLRTPPPLRSAPPSPLG